MLTHMTTVKWDIKEIMSQHSQYVDNLLKVSLVMNCGYMSLTLFLYYVFVYVHA